MKPLLGAVLELHGSKAHNTSSYKHGMYVGFWMDRTANVCWANGTFYIHKQATVLTLVDSQTWCCLGENLLAQCQTLVLRQTCVPASHKSLARCHAKMRTPPKMGTRGPRIPGIMGTRFPILLGNMGTPLGKWGPLCITAEKRYPSFNQFMAGIAYHFNKNQHLLPNGKRGN